MIAWSKRSAPKTVKRQYGVLTAIPKDRVA